MGTLMMRMREEVGEYSASSSREGRGRSWWIEGGRRRGGKGRGEEEKRKKTTTEGKKRLSLNFLIPLAMN